MRSNKVMLCSAIWLCLSGCSIEADPGTDAGGASGVGGSAVSGAGGSVQGGAGVGTGGTSAVSGTSGTSVGGSSAAGGSSGASGASAAGGSLAAGGTSGTSGASGAGFGGAGNAGSGGLAAGGSAGVSGASGDASGGSSSGGMPPGGAGGTLGGAGAGGSGGSGGGTPPPPSGLPVPPGASDVAKPAGTPNNVTVINWAGFKGAVSYSFDDANSSQIQHYSELQALGVPFTFYLWTGKSDASNSIWGQALKDGHELGNHTQSHQSNGTGQDIDSATQFIMQKFGVQAYTMAAPNGASGYTSLAKGRFIINRGVSDNLIGPNDNSDPFTLPTFIPPQGASASAFNSEVDSAQSAGKWRTMCIHGFQGGSDGAYQPVPLDQFISSVNHAKSLGNMWIGTMVDVGSYWLGQKAFSSATTMTQGSDKTWSWTLPDKFPPGKYLRVTVDGGTLKQDGAALAWDGHGYYEIALDAGSVTLSP